jgi:WD40 repeat protein
MKLWDISSRQTLATLKGHGGFLRSVVFSPDGKTLASAVEDNEKKDFAIWLWFAATDEEVARQRDK